MLQLIIGQLLNGVIIGTLYGIIALGVTLTFGITGIVNPETRQAAPLGAAVPAATGGIDIPPAAWESLKEFKPASYFAVTL